MNIVKVTPHSEGVLQIVADDGRSGLMDVRPYFDSPAFRPLKQPDEFAKVRNGRYFIEWPCGADLSADTIEARWTLTSPDTLQGPQPIKR